MTDEPDPQMACERCVWGRGEHAEWCDNYKIQVYLRKWISAAMQEFSDYLLDQPFEVAASTSRGDIQ